MRWKTRSGYASHLRVHVIPSIGAARLTELRPETLERLYRQLIDDGRSTHVVHGVHRVLRSSLNEAVRPSSTSTSASTMRMTLGMKTMGMKTSMRMSGRRP